MSEHPVSSIHRRPRRSRADVAQIVSSYSQSGLSRSQLCRRHGLSLSSLNGYCPHASHRDALGSVESNCQTERCCLPCAVSLCPNSSSMAHIRPTYEYLSELTCTKTPITRPRSGEWEDRAGYSQTGLLPSRCKVQRHAPISCRLFLPKPVIRARRHCSVSQLL